MSNPTGEALASAGVVPDDLECAAINLDSLADLYATYAENPREGTNVNAMRQSSADYREAARIVRSKRSPL